jgi:hypothetical protein
MNSKQPARPGFIDQAARILFAVLAVAFLLGGFEGAVNGDFLFPFGFVLATTFGLLTMLFQFTRGTENIHVVKAAESQKI